MAHPETHSDARYYVPHGSNWPIVGAVGLFILMMGISTWLNGWAPGGWIAWLGVAAVLTPVRWAAPAAGAERGSPPPPPFRPLAVGRHPPPGGPTRARRTRTGSPPPTGSSCSKRSRWRRP